MSESEVNGGHEKRKEKKKRETHEFAMIDEEGKR